MRRLYLWQPWPQRQWPLTAQEERVFVLELRAAAATPFETKPDSTTTQRDDLTLVLDALRCGLTVEFLLSTVNTPADRLYAAYEMIEESRARAVNAWEQIAANPTKEVLVECGRDASRVLPHPVHQITVALHNLHDSRVAEDRLSRLLEEVAATTKAAKEIEHLLEYTEDPAVATRIGIKLYNPYDDSFWTSSFFLPPRVGTLSPTRVSELLVSAAELPDIERELNDEDFEDE